MVIIRLQGGLGNQLFQYALYLQLEAQGRTVRIDEESGFVSDIQRKPCLNSALGIDYEKASDTEIKILRDAFMDPLSRIRRKLTGRKNKEWEEPDGRFHPEVLEMDEVYLNGYFQSEAYFPDPGVREKLAGIFEDSINKRLGSENGGAEGQEQAAEDNAGSRSRELAREIEASGSSAVSLHIRRGDYLQPGTAETHGGICTDAYYEKAVSLILEKVPDAVFYVFSDDPGYAESWAEDMSVHGGSFIAADPGAGKGPADADSLLLMRLCRHHILANSSFSWWGAWPDEGAEDGMIIVPDRWYNNRADDGIYTDRMQRITC